MLDSRSTIDDVPAMVLDVAAPESSSADRGSGAKDRLSVPSMPDGDFHLLDYVRVLHRRRWVAITAFVTIVLGTLVYLFTATPEYEARTQILIENENPNVVSFQEVLEQNKTALDYYQTQYRILQSRALVKRTLDIEKLWNDPLFARRQETSLWGLLPARAGAYTDETTNQSRAIDEFLKHLTVAPVRNSRLVDVRFESPDPQLSARVANAISNAYIEQNLELKSTATKDANDFLKDRMAEQRKAVEQSELALQKYREANDAVSLEDKQNIVVQRLADLNAAVTRARTERIQKETAWNQIRAVQNDRAALDTIPAILSNSFIQQQKAEIADLQRQQAQLSEKFGPRHPDMLKLSNALQQAESKLQTEIAKIVQATRNDYQAALIQEENLSAALEKQKSEAMALNRQSIQYGVLQRDAASNRQIFEGLLNRSKETGIQGELRSTNIRIVDAAEVPSRPARPQKMLGTTFGAIGGALVGISLAFFFEYLDNRVRRPAELAACGLPCLGMVPLIRGAESGSPQLLISGKPPHNFAEAIRAIRTNILFSTAEPGCRTLVVSSTAPSEGKTLIAANVATSLALTGQRVLLIDADLRRPKVHELVGIAQEPGLSNVMVGSAKVSEAVRRGDNGLYVLPAGRIPPNPAELLGSSRFNSLIASLRQHFDWILIDSPPVMAVADAAVVAHLSNGVLFVVGADMTNRNLLHAAVNQLAAARTKVVGAILNLVDFERNAYYYSTYYRRDYGDYYAKNSVSADAS